MRRTSIRRCANGSLGILAEPSTSLHIGVLAQRRGGHLCQAPTAASLAWVFAPLVADLEAWMREERAELSRHSDVAKVMDYMLKRWDSLTGFLVDGRICLTNEMPPNENCAASRRCVHCAPLLQVSGKHWNSIFEIDATRATVSRDRGSDPIVPEIGGTDLVRRAWHDMFGGEHAILDEAADPVVGDVDLRGGFGDREPFPVLLGAAVGTNPVHPPQ
jgi:hypothetical protein